MEALETELWVCPACGAVFDATSEPPSRCALCEDERQYVPPGGQRWSTAGALRSGGHRCDIRMLEPGLTGIGNTPEIGVGQRGLLLAAPTGNLLWDPAPLLDDAAVTAVRAAGGVSVVSSSHPHMYGAMVEWAELFGATIALPAADAEWLPRSSARVMHWNESLAVLDGAVTLVQCGGHFPGSSVAHWPAGAAGAGVLLTGDSLFVCPSQDRVSFIYSAPNRLPLPAGAVRTIVEVVGGLSFDRIYGGWWNSKVVSEGAAVVRRSAIRYLAILEGR